jgi:hypothetical protein
MTMSDQEHQAKYVVHEAIQSAVGDYAQVNNYYPAAQVAVNPGMAELRRLFEEVNRRLDSLDAADRDMVAPAIQQTAEATAAIQQGDESPKKLSFLETRLRNILAMAPDIGEVIVATLASPAAGIALTLQKIARKAKEEMGGKKQAEP